MTALESYSQAIARLLDSAELIVTVGPFSFREGVNIVYEDSRFEYHGVRIFNETPRPQQIYNDVVAEEGSLVVFGDNQRVNSLHLVFKDLPSQEASKEVSGLLESRYTSVQVSSIGKFSDFVKEQLSRSLPMPWDINLFGELLQQVESSITELHLGIADDDQVYIHVGKTILARFDNHARAMPELNRMYNFQELREILDDKQSKKEDKAAKVRDWINRTQ